MINYLWQNYFASLGTYTSKFPENSRPKLCCSIKCNNFLTALITLILIITNLATLLLCNCSSDSGFQDDQPFPTNKNNKQGSKNGTGALGIPKITEPLCLDLETNLRLARMSYQRALQYIPLEEFGQSEDYM